MLWYINLLKVIPNIQVPRFLIVKTEFKIE